MDTDFETLPAFSTSLRMMMMLLLMLWMGKLCAGEEKGREIDADRRRCC
jgi:hypothetical protein